MTGDQRSCELKRLGRRGSYRLGQLRLQGVAPPGPPPARVPRFGPRHAALARAGRWLARVLSAAEDLGPDDDLTVEDVALDDGHIGPMTGMERGRPDSPPRPARR